VSAASWAALPWLASASFDEAGRGVNGFGSFCRNKRSSAAGPRPGIYRTFKKFPGSEMWVESCIYFAPTKAEVCWNVYKRPTYNIRYPTFLSSLAVSSLFTGGRVFTPCDGSFYDPLSYVQGNCIHHLMLLKGNGINGFICAGIRIFELQGHLGTHQWPADLNRDIGVFERKCLGGLPL